MAHSYGTDSASTVYKKPTTTETIFGNTPGPSEVLPGWTGLNVNNNGFPEEEKVEETGSGGYKRAAAAAPAMDPYTATTIPAATSQEAYIRDMYAQNRLAEEAALKAAYDANVATLNQQAAQLPQTYDQAANQAAAQAAISRAAYNESMAASGMNTGAGSQAQLAQNNALLSEISGIRREQANRQAEIENQRTALSTEYQNAIAKAIQQNNLQQAQALYQEAIRVDQSLASAAQTQAEENYKEWYSKYLLR